MKQIIQCPDCKALKFKDQKGIFWQPICEDEQIAFDIILSSPALQVIAGQVQVLTEVCFICNAKHNN